jgi:hypothetical protein
MGKIQQKLSWKFPECTVPCTTTHNVVTKLRSRGLALVEEHKRRYVWTEDKFYASTQLVASPKKLSFRFALQCGLIKRTAHIGINLPKLRRPEQQSYVTSPPPPQGSKQELDILGGFSNQYSVDFLI